MMLMGDGLCLTENLACKDVFSGLRQTAIRKDLTLPSSTFVRL